jgi:hypothetical protein
MIHTRQLTDHPIPAQQATLVAFRAWRVVDGELRSPFLGVTWSSPVLRADCYRDLPLPVRSARRLDAPHLPGHPCCSCGVSARRVPDGDFARVDFRGVSGIVRLSGEITLEGEAIRAEQAQVVALALYDRWPRDHARAVRAIAERFEADVVDLDDLEAAAAEHRRAPDVAYL